MKILQVIHDFLPRHTAGSEVYTYKLSKELVKRGHEVSLFFTEAERGTRQYTLREGAYDGLPYFEAIVNRDYSGFTETYENAAMDRLFTEVLDKTGPDIIHIQHLINHSLNYIKIAKDRSIPVVFTLHDYWLTCPLGGQRMTPGLSICHEIEVARCARCVSRYSKNSFRLKRLFAKISGRLQNTGDSDLTASLDKARVEGTQRRFVKKGRLTFNGDSRAAILTSRASTITFKRNVREASLMSFAIGVKAKNGAGDINKIKEREGIYFKVLVDDDEVFCEVLPTAKDGGEGWHGHELDLEKYSGKKVALSLVTGPESSFKESGLTAGWADVRVESKGAESASKGKRLAARSLLKFNSLFDAVAAKKLVPTVNMRLEKVLQATQGVDLFISPSRFLKERFVEFGIPAEKILYSDNGFDVSAFSTKKKRSGKHKKIRFGYTGSLVPHKGVHVLVSAFSGLGRKDREHAELKIYGNLTWFPDYVAKLREEAGDSGVRFMGAFDNKDIIEVLSEIDVLVVPSIWFENSPLTIHEAFLSGIPVITSNIGGMAELVQDGVSGLVFKVGDAAGLRGKMEELIRDKKLLNRLIAGLPEVKTIAEDADNMEKRYMRLISCKAPRLTAMAQA